MRILSAVFNYLVFPGFIFSAAVGLFAGWVDRKVTARLQWRAGPPWHQNFTDIVKLLHKEITLPGGSKSAFLLAPYAGLMGIVFTATIIGLSIIDPAQGFTGDIIVLVYLLTIPAIALILGASSSNNPLASVGASREIKLVLGYELPFLLSVIAVIIKTGGLLRISSIIDYQQLNASLLFSASGVLAFIVAIFCMQAKLGLVPFDMSEAEQEIMAGTLIEYSGLPLAAFRLTKAMLLYVMPLFLIVLFMGRDLSVVFIAGKYVLLLVIIVLIKNTNPRMRIDQALRFFWGPATLLALLAVVLAVLGK